MCKLLKLCLLATSLLVNVSAFANQSCPYCMQQAQVQNIHSQSPGLTQYYYYPTQTLTQPTYTNYWPANLPPKAIEIRGTNLQGQTNSFYGKFDNSLGDYGDY